MEKRLYGIRGAVFAQNTKDAIISAVDMLFSRLFAENHLESPQDIVSIQFTVTQDLTAFNPAAALRQSSAGGMIKMCALFCSQEPAIDGAYQRVIRTLVTAYFPRGHEPVHVFTNGAEILRPDFSANRASR